MELWPFAEVMQLEKNGVRADVWYSCKLCGGAAPKYNEGIKHAKDCPITMLQNYERAHEAATISQNYEVIGME